MLEENLDGYTTFSLAILATLPEFFVRITKVRLMLFDGPSIALLITTMLDIRKTLEKLLYDYLIRKFIAELKHKDFIPLNMPIIRSKLMMKK
jgi:hypothetical protein